MRNNHPQLPFKNYMEAIKATADRHGIRIIMLITPETSKESIRLIDKNTNGFIYMVSSPSSTGTQNKFDSDTLEHFKKVNSMKLRNPRMSVSEYPTGRHRKAHGKMRTESSSEVNS